MQKPMKGPIMHMLGELVDAFILTMLWLICSLPIITLGAASTALSRVALQLSEGGTTATVQVFFRKFKEEFRQSTVIWMIFLLISVVLVFGYWGLFHFQGLIIELGMGILLIAGIINVFMLIYMFPLIAKFHNKTLDYFKIAFIMSIKHFPSTIGIILILVGAGFAVYYVLPFAVLSIGLVAMLTAKIFNRVFSKYIPHEIDRPEEIA